MRMNAAVAHGCLALALVCFCAFDFAADAPLTEGQKLEKEVKQLISESDKLLMTEKGYTRDSKAVEQGIKILERAEELAGKASEIDPDKYDKLAQTVAMKLYGARKNTTLHLADTPRKTVAAAPQPPKQAPPVAPATTTPPPAVTPPAPTPPATTPPVATTPPANTPPWPPEAPAVGTVKAVADATKPTTPAPAATTPAPETPTRRNAAPEPETTTRKPAEAAPETTRKVADANVSEGAARRAREAAAAAEAPAAPANAVPPVAAPPVIRRDKVFVLKDGRKIVAQRVIDTETEHVIKDMAGKTHAVSKDDVAQVIEQDTVIGGAPGDAAAPSKKFTVYTLKDGRKINAVKVLDVGEQLSIKDDRNKFIVIEKADVVDPKL